MAYKEPPFPFSLRFKAPPFSDLPTVYPYEAVQLSEEIGPDRLCD